MEKAVLVIGGGIAGIQASLDLADKGIPVHLVEKSPSIGGRMAQLDKTFPTNDCSICILAPKMADCFGHPNINVMTYSEVKEVSGKAGDFTVKILKKSRFVDETKCTGCCECIEKCPTKVPNEWEQNLGVRRAIYIPFMQAVPRVVTIDRDVCRKLTEDKCGVCAKVCKREAIDYEMKDQEGEINVSAIVVATGYDLWDPSVAPEYGYGKYPNVFTAMEYERMINAAGPTGGHIKRRSDGEHPKKMAFIQCVGSRNPQMGHPYCCAVCCMFSVKESMLAREHYDDIESTIFYKDLRTCSKNFYEYTERARNDYGVRTINSDGTVKENPENKNPIVVYDVGGRPVEEEFDIVVLASTLIPRKDAADMAKMLGIKADEWGFYTSPDRVMNPGETNVSGIFVAGYCAGPADIPESVAQGSGVAAKAFEVLAGSER
ncbi:MAG TPA: CoB--CoM heterodisulfide reductase iron-sulfur subunit A family protein [Euryarchaeota archaeon]|nr:CoB--CoM heterodisulfide reductase iron-sulfur subunit A family protein [Euryarchaeota archaeon]